MYHVMIDVPGGSITAEICYSRHEAEKAADRYGELFFFCGYEVLKGYVVTY